MNSQKIYFLLLLPDTHHQTRVSTEALPPSSNASVTEEAFTGQGDTELEASLVPLGTPFASTVGTCTLFPDLHTWHGTVLLQCGAKAICI